MALARLNPDGTPDIAFGQHGQVITDLSTPSRTVQGLPRSVLVQRDGNIVVTGTASSTVSGQALSAFAVARYVGTIVPGSGSIPGGNYEEDFTNGLDKSGIFQHTFWFGAQTYGPANPFAVESTGWEVGNEPGSDGGALELTGATDTITFPNLRGVQRR
jgi:hypothetical protein